MGFIMKTRLSDDSKQIRDLIDLIKFTHLDLILEAKFGDDPFNTVLLEPLMPGGNKKVAHVTFLLPPGIKGLKTPYDWQ